MEINQVKNIKAQTDKISPFFCTAKWLEGTICLQNLTTHSCHHCRPHKIPFKSIRKNSDAFYNTPERKLSRKEMLSGKIPKECSYCALPEKKGALSERFAKSTYLLNQKHRENILAAGHTENINPLSLEIIFSSACNLKCAYCLPQNSTSVYQDYLKYGPYYADENFWQKIISYFRWLKVKRRFLFAKKQKDVKEIFNKWLIAKLSCLKKLRITGGEPLLSRDTFSLLDELKTKKYPELSFSVNTNLALPSEKVEEFFNQLEDVSENLKTISVYTSLDALGKKGEYIRAGLSFYLFEQNVIKLLSLKKDIGLNYMITVSLFNLSSVKDVLFYILQQRKKFPHKKIGFSFSSVTFPKYLSPYMADQEQKKHFSDALSFMQENKTDGFSEAEIIQAESVLSVIGCKNKSGKSLKTFKNFVQAFDYRNKSDFSKTFPENAYLLKK